MKVRVAVLTWAFVLAVASLAMAHDTWLLPAAAQVHVGDRMMLDMTSGMSFPRNETAIDSARIDEMRMRLSGDETKLAIRSGGRTALKLVATARHAGVATIWVRLKPRRLELKPDQVREYLDEIGAPDSIRSVYLSTATPRPWREQYTKIAKTFVVVERPGRDSSWALSTGAALEIVPSSSPVGLAVGDTLRVRVLRHGKPAPGFSVGDVAEGERHGRLTRTDDAGSARLVAAKPGRWLLRGTDLRRAIADSTLEWQSEFTTLTLFVKPRR